MIKKIIISIQEISAMKQIDRIKLCIFIILLLISVPIVGEYLGHVFSSPPSFLASTIGQIESAIYKMTGINPSEEMPWETYLRKVAHSNFLVITM